MSSYWGTCAKRLSVNTVNDCSQSAFYLTLYWTVIRPTGILLITVQYRLTLSVPDFFFFLNFQLEISLYVKLKDWMSNSVDPDETAHFEPSHLDLRCLQNPIIIAYGSEGVNRSDIDLSTMLTGFIFTSQVFYTDRCALLHSEVENVCCRICMHFSLNCFSCWTNNYNKTIYKKCVLFTFRFKFALSRFPFSNRVLSSYEKFPIFISMSILSIQSCRFTISDENTIMSYWTDRWMGENKALTDMFQENLVRVLWTFQVLRL